MYTRSPTHVYVCMHGYRCSADSARHRPKAAAICPMRPRSHAQLRHELFPLVVRFLDSNSSSQTHRSVFLQLDDSLPLTTQEYEV